MKSKFIQKIKNHIAFYLREDLQERISEEFERAFVLNNRDLPATLVLPEGYGKGLPERVVELLLARMTYHAGAKVLDVAHANAMPCHLKMVESLPQPAQLTGIDIAEPVYNTSTYYRESLVGDITRMTFDEGSFDLIWCISALEHFGMDNSGYTDNFRKENNMDLEAVAEMIRILKRGGSLLVTVPYGKNEDHGWLRNYDKESWLRVLAEAEKQADVKQYYFRHTFGSGWRETRPEELQYVGYFDQANCGSGGLAAAYITKR
ncbi:class I SAM-dependent methyltransferase [Geomonas sp. Red32]|nr:class I SAM-dependent methyltransferase [Geomonas sp. Red32]